MNNITSVTKEQIKEIKFAQEEVLKNISEISKRRADLEKAATLGNGYKTKSKIVFETEEGLKQIETHVWAAMEKNVALKGGINIPIRCIHDVMF